MRSRTANWFVCKIRYEKTGEDGLQKKVTETYVVDALTFTEAEARITEEMASYISGEFKIMNIDPAPFAEIFFAPKRKSVVQLCTWSMPDHSTEPLKASRK